MRLNNFAATLNNEVLVWNSDTLIRIDSDVENPDIQTLLCNESSCNKLDGSGIKFTICYFWDIIILTNNGNVYVKKMTKLIKMDVENVNIIVLAYGIIYCVSGNCVSIYDYSIGEGGIKKLKIYIFNGNIKKMIHSINEMIILTDSSLYKWDIGWRRSLIDNMVGMELNNCDQIMDMNCNNSLIILSVIENGKVEFYIDYVWKKI